MTRAAALLGFVGLAACGGAHEVQLTLRVDDSVAIAELAQVRSVEIAILGAEAGTARYPIGAELVDRKLTWLYKAKSDGARRFDVTLRADGRRIVAGGRSQVLTPGGSPVAETIHLVPGGPPNKLRLGQKCAAGVDVCASGFCVDGLCCDDACEGACRTCNGPTPGRCAAAVVGTNPRKACKVDPGAPCGLDGTCDGASACRIALAGTTCAQPRCAGGVATLAATCDGLGACGTPATRDCAPYACTSMGSGCATICTAAAGCAMGVSCNAGNCGKVGLGARCFGGGECLTGQCIDGTCCETTCDGPCRSCHEPGQEGRCVLTAAGLADPHSTCLDDGVASCGRNGKCDGMGGCQGYPAGAVCAAGACAADASAASAPSQCAGDGTPCPEPATTACGPYRCVTDDGAPGCEVSCGECAYFDPDHGPPFAARCADGATCTDRCLAADERFTCQ